MTAITVSRSGMAYVGVMMLGAYLALGVFAFLVVSVLALMIRIDRVAGGPNQRIDALRDARH